MYLNIKALLFAGIGLFSLSCLPEGRPPKEFTDAQVQDSSERQYDSSNNDVHRQFYDLPSSDKFNFPSEVNASQDAQTGNKDTFIMDTTDSIPSLDSVVETLLIDVPHTDTLLDLNDGKAKQDVTNPKLDSLQDTSIEKTDTNTNPLDLIDSFITKDSSVKMDSLVDIVLTETSTDSSDTKAKQDTTNQFCYVNKFNAQSDFDDLIVQSGDWSWNYVEGNGYIYQAIQGLVWNVAYLNSEDYTDFSAKIKVKMLNQTPQTGVNSQTGLVFRYDPNTMSGYYLKFGDIKGDGPFKPEVSFELSLGIFGAGIIYSTTLKGNPYDLWQELGVIVQGQNISAFFNGEEIFKVQDSLCTFGKIGFTTHNAQSQIDDLEICPPENDVSVPIPYQPDENTLILLNFDNPEPLINLGKESVEVTDYGTMQTESAEGFGQARRFDGISYLEIVGSNNLGLTDQLTIEARIKPLIEGKSYSDSFGNIVAGVGGTGIIFIGEGYVSGALGSENGDYQYVETKYELPTTEFTHLRMTYNGEFLRLFVNLSLKDELYFPGTIQYVDYENTFIGWSVYNGFIGDIDEVRVSNVAREF